MAGHISPPLNCPIVAGDYAPSSFLFFSGRAGKLMPTLGLSREQVSFSPLHPPLSLSAWSLVHYSHCARFHLICASQYDPPPPPPPSSFSPAKIRTSGVLPHFRSISIGHPCFFPPECFLLWGTKKKSPSPFLPFLPEKPSPPTFLPFSLLQRVRRPTGPFPFYFFCASGLQLRMGEVFFLSSFFFFRVRAITLHHSQNPEIR